MLFQRFLQQFPAVTFAIFALVLTGNSFQIASLQAAEFRPIYAKTISGSDMPDFGGPVAFISSLSGDGSTIGGTITLTSVAFDCAVNECENTAFVWSIENEHSLDLNIVELPSPVSIFSGASPRRVSALSHDGSLALVTSEARWYVTTIQSAHEFQLLESGDADDLLLLGAAMSSDGKVVAGSIGSVPALWNESTGIIPIPDLPADSELLPVAISGNGQTVALMDRGYRLGTTVRQATNFFVAENVAVWNESQGLQALEPAPGNERALLSSINTEGSIITGASSHFAGPGSVRILTATRWEDGLPVTLNSVDDFDSTIATDISADGTIIVGVARYEPTPGVPVNVRDLRKLRTRDQAVLWKDDVSLLLRDLLVTDYGLAEELEGWRLTLATAISDDGNTIAGHGIDPEGNSAAWVVTLGVPEPGAGLLLLIGLLFQAAIGRV